MLGFGASAVANLNSKLGVKQTSNYYNTINNYFTSLALLRHLSTMRLAVTRTVRTNRMENAPLQDIVKMNKEKRGSSDVVTDVSSNITAVRWKDNKFVNAISAFTGKQPIQQAKRCCHRENRRVNIEQPNILNQYNTSMGVVDCTDLVRWWWPLFRFVVDMAVNNAY